MPRVILETNPDLPTPEHAPAVADSQGRLDRPREQGARDARGLNGLSADPGLKRFDVANDVG